jgi:hypothetical protein
MTVCSELQQRNTRMCFLEKVHGRAYGEDNLLKQTAIISSFDVVSFNSQHVMIATPHCT